MCDTVYCYDYLNSSLLNHPQYEDACLYEELLHYIKCKNENFQESQYYEKYFDKNWKSSYTILNIGGYPQCMQETYIDECYDEQIHKCLLSIDNCMRSVFIIVEKDDMENIKCTDAIDHSKIIMQSCLISVLTTENIIKMQFIKVHVLKRLMIKCINAYYW